MSIPQPGQTFPDFDLAAAIPSPAGTQKNNLSLSDFQGAPFVIFVYPKDATCGCTTEVCGFRDEYSSFEKIGAQVVGVSRDKISAHLRFIENQNLPFPLVADSEQTLLRACGLIQNATMYGKPITRVLRTTFALDENGIVLRVWEKVAPDGHAAQVVAFLHERANERPANQQDAP